MNFSELYVYLKNTKDNPGANELSEAQYIH